MTGKIEKTKSQIAAMAAEIPEKEARYLPHPGYNFKQYSYAWWSHHQLMAWDCYFNHGDIPSAKQHFYTCGKIDAIRVGRYNERLFEFGRTHISYVALSDNASLIKEFADLNYKIEGESRGKKITTSFKERAAEGNMEIYCDTMIKAMAGDKKGLARNIDVFEKVTSLKKKYQNLEPDFRFFKAILNSDKETALEVIEELTTPRTHRARNVNEPFFNELVSQPAIGFAKIAWLNGLEIQPSSRFIPKDLLPIQPNSQYNDDFLKYDK